jgi:hypothetical protein
VWPLKQQLMPVIRAAHIERGLNNGVQFVLAGLTPEPCAVVVNDVSGLHKYIEDVVHLASPVFLLIESAV